MKVFKLEEARQIYIQVLFGYAPRNVEFMPHNKNDGHSGKYPAILQKPQ